MAHVRQMDYTLNTVVRKAVEEEAAELRKEFYSVANDYAKLRIEEAFQYELRSFVDYGVRSIARNTATHRNEVRKLIEKAAKLSRGSSQQPRPEGRSL